MKLNHDSRHALLAKWHKRASADHRSGVGKNTVRKDHVERHR
jgi:hypothetical protein